MAIKPLVWRCAPTAAWPVSAEAGEEDIMVKDRRDLVGADHARRQFGRLIKN